MLLTALQGPHHIDSFLYKKMEITIIQSISFTHFVGDENKRKQNKCQQEYLPLHSTEFIYLFF